MHTYSPFFPNEPHSDMALVTSGELQYEHQVASAEVLMEFNVASCLGGLSVGWGSRPQFTQIPCVVKSLLRCRWKRVESCQHLCDLVWGFLLRS